MDIREALASAIDTAETSAPEAPPEIHSEPATEVSAPLEGKTETSARTRDDHGRFARTQATEAKGAELVNPQAAQPPAVQAAPQPAAINRPSTWRKEYWPLYDKLATGQPLTAEEAKQIADYTNERESQFKSGVSTYKAEAEAARELQQAIAPFVADWQKAGLAPSMMVNRLGRAHQTLATASPQEKLQMFQRLAHDYGVPINALVQAANGQHVQIDPNVQMLYDELATTKREVTQLRSAYDHGQQQQVADMVHAFKSDPKNSFFDAVQAQMARLLETGFAQDLNDAYDKAIRLDPSVWSQVQTHEQAQRAQQAQMVAAKAKAAVVSPKSASPSSQGEKTPKGLRAVLEQTVESALGSSRV